MDLLTKQAEEPDLTEAGDAAAAITTLARDRGVTAEAQPIDAFADATSRLSASEASPDRIERLLIGLQRAGVIADQERFALHAVYLRQQASRLPAVPPAAPSHGPVSGIPGPTTRLEDRVRAGIASVRIEGGDVDQEARELLARWADQDISAEDLMAQILNPYSAGR